MDNDLFAKLRTINPTILTDVVRQDQNDSSFEITVWNVKRLSDKGIANPDGLWLFHGQGNNGKETHPWAIVLKVLERQEDESPQDNLWYWKREYLLAQSGLTENLPVKAPRFYHSEETSDGAWIWMEHVEDYYPGPWTLESYAFAAHQLGLWNGLYKHESSLPNENWFARQPYRTWLGLVNAEEDWKFLLNQKHISTNTRNRYERLWNERDKYFETLERLPQVFSHFDSQRRNLLIRMGKNRQKELVALDWAQCGIGAIGAELSWLVGMSTFLLEWSPSGLSDLTETAFQSYVKGLQESSWSGDIDMVRLGYVSMLAVYIGCAFPALTRIWCSTANKEFALQILGLAEEDLFWKIFPVLDYTLDRAEEAGKLMKKLQLP